MIVKARIVVTMDGPPILDGAIWIQGERIQAVGPWAEIQNCGDPEVLDLGGQVVLPGLINAHCHLDYTMMRSAIAPPANFTAWVQRINALKRSLDAEDYLAAIARGFTKLKRWGTTTVCNIEAFPELMQRIPPPPIRTWWFYEMIDIRHRITTDDVVAGALSFFQRVDNQLGGFGLSPHSPYTASRELYQLANNFSPDMPLMTHLAESKDEFAMFATASGPLYDFLASLKRPMGDCGHATPFQLLWANQSINSRWILTHMNELTESDFALLSSLHSLPHIVHCPGSHRYFRHSPFAFRRLHDLGLNLCTATDSLASTDSLSLLKELRRLREDQPWLTARQLLATVTLNPARALNREGLLGILCPNALADLIALPSSATPDLVLEEIVNHDKPINWMMINGKAVV